MRSHAHVPFTDVRAKCARLELAAIVALAQDDGGHRTGHGDDRRRAGPAQRCMVLGWDLRGTLTVAFGATGARHCISGEAPPS